MIFDILPWAAAYYQLLELKNPDRIGDIKLPPPRIIETDLKLVVDTLESVFLDYIPHACIMEASNAYGESGICDYSIGVCEDNMLKYNPEQFMPVLYELFSDYEWSDSFGGSAWANIVEAYLYKYKLSKELWVHQILGLAHNNGSFFDKGGVININLDKFKSLQNSRVVKNMFLAASEERIHFLGIPSFSGMVASDEICPVTVYIPLKWGELKVGNPERRKPEDDYSNYSEPERYYDI